MKIKILVAADRSFAMENLVSSIDGDESFEMSEPVNTRKALINLLRQELPQILILDINMPTIDGIETLMGLNIKYPVIKTIVVSEYNSRTLVAEIKKLGAKGYFLKDIPFDQFKKNVFEVHQGLNWVDYLPANSERPAPYYFSGEFAGYRLTKRELDVIRLLCKRYTCEEVGDFLYLSKFSTKIIKENIYRKLGLQNENQLINFAKENNIVD